MHVWPRGLTRSERLFNFRSSFFLRTNFVTSAHPLPDVHASRSAYFREEHDMLRAQVRRFVKTEIKP
jgi:hypothetical protein